MSHRHGSLIQAAACGYFQIFFHNERSRGVPFGSGHSGSFPLNPLAGNGRSFSSSFRRSDRPDAGSGAGPDLVLAPPRGIIFVSFLAPFGHIFNMSGSKKQLVRKLFEPFEPLRDLTHGWGSKPSRAPPPGSAVRGCHRPPHVRCVAGVTPPAQHRQMLLRAASER